MSDTVRREPTEERVDPLLRGSGLGRRYCYVESTGSTSDDVMAMAEEGEPEGAVVCSLAQTRGRGREGRSWYSPEGGGLYLSVLLRPETSPDLASQLTLVAAVATARAIREAAPCYPGIKWPNDLLVRGRKLAGILCDSRSSGDRVRYVVAGAGINVDLDPAGLPGDLGERATSLLAETGERTDMAVLAASLLNNLSELYRGWRADGLEAVAEEWESLSVMRGRRVRAELPDGVVEGRALGLDPSGGLRVEKAGGGMISLRSGDLSLL